MTYIGKACHRQGNGFNCGVFAIAFATSLANGQDPSTLLYSPYLLRTHLNECIAKGYLSPFPSTICRVKRARKDSVLSESVFCQCRRTSYMLPAKGWTMVECEISKECFHSMCVDNFLRAMLAHCTKSICQYLSYCLNFSSHLFYVSQSQTPSPMFLTLHLCWSWEEHSIIAFFPVWFGINLSMSLFHLY